MLVRGRSAGRVVAVVLVIVIGCDRDIPEPVTDDDRQPAPDGLDRVDVSVLIPVRNEGEHIAATVAAMRAQRYPGTIELLFADGRSEDDTVAQLERFALEDPRIRVFDNPRVRTPSGLNVCLRHARGRYVARMDAHTFYPEDYVSLGVERLRRGGTTWVSGPAIPQPVGRVSRAVALALQSRVGQGGSRKWRGGEEAAAPEVELDTGVFAGVWERDVVLAFGGWDERWPANQDAEMAGRFMAAGHRLVMLPAMGARYVPRDRLRGLWRQYWGYGHYRVQTSNRHPDSMRRSLLATPGLVVTAAAAVIAPRPLRRAARALLALYAGALVHAAAGAARRGEPVEDAALIPVVLATMHSGHGVGVLHGMARFGPPWAALRRVTGLDRLLPAAPVTEPEQVHAPSLGES
jgi:glycosyltransferase involved in cell wall biosynthesis